MSAISETAHRGPMPDISHATLRRKRTPRSMACYAERMRDFAEYLRAYRAYVATSLGWGKALRLGLGWLAGLFVPLVAKTLVQVPDWAPITWMIGWSLFGYILAPYGLWKHNRAEVARLSRPERR